MLQGVSVVKHKVTLQGNAAGPNELFDNLNVDLDVLEAELDDDYMDIEEFGFVMTVRKILKTILKTVRGLNCLLKEVTNILEACTKYVDAIDACGTAVPKDVAAIVTSCKTIITLCHNIINPQSDKCAPSKGDDADTDADSTQSTSRGCFLQSLRATIKLTKKIKSTVNQISKLPTDTSSCFSDSTNAVKESFNNFLPNIRTC